MILPRPRYRYFGSTKGLIGVKDSNHLPSAERPNRNQGLIQTF
jgi:hypothetical protein